jgi:hypothetical protein
MGGDVVSWADLAWSTHLVARSQCSVVVISQLVGFLFPTDNASSQRQSWRAQMADARTDDGSTELRHEWIKRVLSVDPTAAAASPTPADLVGLWWDAKDRVNAQIDDLRRVFMATEHPLATAACEAGLGAFSGGVLVRFQAALLNYKQASAAKRAAVGAQLGKVAADLRSFIADSAMLPLLEGNPFGVNVTIRPEVLRALDAILAQLPR